MAKNIIFCADGTWQSSSSNTNVYRFFKSLLISGSQIAFYDDGVGADGSGLGHILGGAFGEGLNDKIKMAYAKIAHVYEAGDEIFLYGFSRGAFTARCLGGMIANIGLPLGSFNDALVDGAFAAYRDPDDRAAMLAKLSAYNLADATIRMVGVWDTVGSLGIPSLIGGVDPLRYGFLDTTLHPDVKNAFQCLAIDERRAEFPATLWTGAPAPGQTIEQVWFTGCHGDVGGGCAPDDADGGTLLSDVTLIYMLQRAYKLGLQIDPAVLSSLPTAPARYALDALHESWSALWGIPASRHIDPASSVANSVAVRLQYENGYAPGNLSISNRKLAGTYHQVAVVADSVA